MRRRARRSDLKIRRSRRSRKSLALVFALIFAPATTRLARAACVEFTTPPALSLLADGAVSVAAADVDGDGDMDVLSDSFYSGQAAWFENGGDGSTWIERSIGSTAQVSAIVAADLDGDGDMDALSASTSGRRILWFENEGSGTSWSMQTISTTAWLSSSVFAADVDRDGDLDALSASYTDDKIAWYENLAASGDASLWTLHSISVLADGAISVSAADVDGDGDVDVLSASYLDDKIAWYENNGDASLWTLHTISVLADGAYSVFAADVDGDGDIDALAASKLDNRILWFENNGAGTLWTLQVISESANKPLSVAAADLDGDGDLDALSASTDDAKIAWYENLAPGNGATWSAHTLSLSALGAFQVVAADLDGDGDTDAVSASFSDDKIAWYRNDQLHDQALFAPTATISNLASGARSVFAADVDGDGDLDALSASADDDKFAWYENTGGSGNSWSVHDISTIADFAFSAFAADVDGDGDLDALATSAYDDTIAWYENLGGGGTSWTLHIISSTSDGALSVVAADVDGDGDLDALAASHFDNRVAWYENVGGGGTSWTLHVISTTASAVYLVFAADVDGDGDLDALSASGDDDKIAWYENVGGAGASWTLHTISVSADGARSVFAADVDADGDLDVVSASNNDGKIAWYENVGGGGTVWGVRTISTTALGADSVFAADVDADGDLDVLSASEVDSKIAWYENVGGGGTSWVLRTIVTSAPGAFTVIAADVDGDGDLDALSASLGDNKIAWYPNLGSGVFDDGFDSDANDACWSSAVP